MSTQSRATSLREAGNERFKKRDYEGAIDFYSQSLKVEETAACYSNRALCYINLHKYSLGLKDADMSISLDPLFVKSWLRRGICRMELKQPQLAYFDLLRAQELNPDNKDIEKQLEACRKAEIRTYASLDAYVKEMVASMRECFVSSGSNEAVSYVKDILQFRPADEVVLEEVAALLEEKACWEQASKVLEKLTVLAKGDEARSLGFLLRRVRADAERGESGAAAVGLKYYNSHSGTRRDTALVQQIEAKLNPANVTLQNALSLAEERMELPPAPTSLYNLTYNLQSIKDSPALIQKYLMSISPSRFGELFSSGDADCEPYEMVISCLRDILEHNISHCYWAVDVLQGMKSSVQFPLVRSLLPETTIAKLMEMREMIAKTGKVSESFLDVFSEYLSSFPVCFQ